jgi:hypothetical protein
MVLFGATNVEVAEKFELWSKEVDVVDFLFCFYDTFPTGAIQ